MVTESGTGTAPSPAPAPLAERPQPAPIVHARPIPMDQLHAPQGNKNVAVVSFSVPRPVQQEERAVPTNVQQPIDPNVRLESRIVPESPTESPTRQQPQSAGIDQNAKESLERIGDVGIGAGRTEASTLPQRRPILRIGAVGGQPQGNEEYAKLLNLK